MIVGSRKFFTYFSALVFWASLAGAIPQETDAPATEWEFSGTRQPQYSDFERRQALGVNEQSGCADWRGWLYDNYADRHPEFKSLMYVDGMRRRWQRSLILHGDEKDRGANYCFFNMLHKQVLTYRPDRFEPRIIFCGSIPADLEAEQTVVAQAAEELTEYAFDGNFSGVLAVAPLHGYNDAYQINADVRHYLNQEIDQQTPPGHRDRKYVEEYYAPEAAEQLSPERRQFVDEAFARGDYQAVLATTPPCP